MSTNTDTEDFLKNLVANNFTVDKEEIQKKLDDWKNVKVNLGVVGDSGSGKSTLINSLRDLFPTDKDAAPVGSEKETTQFPKPFKHPKNDNVIVWDIPGCNTPKFPINDYMRDIKQVRDEFLQEFDEHVKKYEILNVNPKSISYDLFIICCKDRFKETDLKIATEISKSSRNYYFVRTFIDQTIRNKESDIGKVLRNKPEEIDKIMTTIRLDIRLQLSEKQLPHSERNLFIISSLMKKIEDDDGNLLEFEDNREKYEFPKLQQQIFEGLDEQKKSALIMTFSAFGVEGVKNKCKKFRNDIWLVSALSGASGLSPIPGTSLLIDMGILIDQVTRYIDELNLNKEKIRQYCMTFGVKYDDLKRDVLSKDPFFKSILSLGITISATIREGIKAITKMASDAARKSLTELIIKFLSKRFVAQTAEELLKSLGLTVPIVGTIISSLIGAGISFTTTLLSLRSILSNFEENHIKIIEYCKAKNNSNSQN